MSEQKTPYNQIDFVIKAPRFRIVFSYMDDKGVAFVREYLLRLLKVTPCKPEQIAQYFGFNQRETEIALADLEQQKWITWQSDGTIALSEEGLRLFQNNEQNTPKIPTLKEFGGEYYMELLDNNFLQKRYCNIVRQQAIELEIEPKILSESQEIVRTAFQNRFRQLMEDGIIALDDKDISLYKIDAIEPKGAPDYFRFTQAFELLPETGEAKERHDVATIVHQDNIQQAITTQLEKFGNYDNLDELQNSMEEIGNEDAFIILSSGLFDAIKFKEIQYQSEQKNIVYFLGQIYHQSKNDKNNPNMVFDEIETILNKLNKESEANLNKPKKASETNVNKPNKVSKTRKLYWLAPSDIYWGKQRKIHDKLQNFVDKQKAKNYEFRLYLPLPAEHNHHKKQEWKNQFRDISEKVLYGFCEGFLEGNTEILFLEDEFAVVCYHARLNAYPVTLPIGFMTRNKKQIKHIVSLVTKFLTAIKHDEVGYQTNDLGLLSSSQK